MTPGIIIPLVALPVALIVLWRWYVKSIRTASTDEPREVSGGRLTAEALHRLPAPPMRVVYEIGERLADIDHVVVAPAGIVAIRTIAADRPAPERVLQSRPEATIVAETAVARGAVDELLTTTSAGCDMLAYVYWGTPDPRRHAVEEFVHASVYVEGQRLGEWLTDWSTNAPAKLDGRTVDAAWQAIVTGIGRPDPLA